MRYTDRNALYLKRFGIDICSILFTDHNVIAEMNTHILHRFARCNQSKELTLADKSFGI